MQNCLGVVIDKAKDNWQLPDSLSLLIAKINDFGLGNENSVTDSGAYHSANRFIKNVRRETDAARLFANGAT